MALIISGWFSAAWTLELPLRFHKPYIHLPGYGSHAQFLFVCFSVVVLLLGWAISPRSLYPLSSLLGAPAPAPALAVSFQLSDTTLVSPSLGMRKHFDCCENHWIKKALPSSATHPFPPSSTSPSAYLPSCVFSVLCVLWPRRAAEACGLSDRDTQNSQREWVQPIHQTRVGACLPSLAMSSLHLEGRAMARSK